MAERRSPSAAVSQQANFGGFQEAAGERPAVYPSSTAAISPVVPPYPTPSPSSPSSPASSERGGGFEEHMKMMAYQAAKESYQGGKGVYDEQQGYYRALPYTLHSSLVNQFPVLCDTYTHT